MLTMVILFITKLILNYHKILLRNLRPLSILRHLPQAVPGEGLVNVNFTRNWGGKTSIIEDGIDD